MGITHAFVSAKSDGADATKVQPSNWNAEHVIEDLWVRAGYDEYTTNTNLTIAIPSDDTIPTSSEGTEILSVSVVVATATQRLRIKFSGQTGVAESAANYVIWGIYQDTTCVASRRNDSGYDETSWIGGEVEVVPGAAATYTISVRVGSNVTMRMNGTSSARLFGGVNKSTLIVDICEPS